MNDGKEAEREEPRNDADLDDLLPLKRRRVFDRDLVNLTGAATEERPVSLVMLDLDHFKNINDTFGHPAGDVVLKKAAQIVKTACEAKGIAYRFGGEELAILLPNYGLAEAGALAERIRSSVAGADFAPCTKLVTASLGVASIPRTSDSDRRLLEDADRALYKAKQTGRNKVCVAGDQGARLGLAQDIAACTSSPLVMLQSTDTPLVLYTPVLEAEWGNHKVRLVLKPDDEADMAALDGLRQGTTKLVASYLHNVAVCRLVDVTHITKGTDRLWELKLDIEVTDFTPDMEMAFAGESAEALAEIRARRILLNEAPAQESKDFNEISREMFVRGFQTLSQPERSPFPMLFQVFGKNLKEFLEIAWICAVTILKLSASVAQVDRLSLRLEGGSLSVDFAGRRKKKYVNHPPHEIEVRGICQLATSAANRSD